MNHPTLYSMRWLWWHDWHPAPDPRRGVLRGFLGGGVTVYRPVFQILTRFQTQKCHFPHPFSDQISKIHTNYQIWSILACSRLSDSGEGSPVSSCFIFVFALSQFSGPNYLGAWNRLGLIRQKFITRVFLFLSYSFGIETINSFIHVPSRSSLESRPKWAKCFQTKNAQKPYLLGRTYLYGLYKGVPPGPDHFHGC